MSGVSTIRCIAKGGSSASWTDPDGRRWPRGSQRAPRTSSARRSCCVAVGVGEQVDGLPQALLERRPRRRRAGALGVLVLAGQDRVGDGVRPDARRGPSARAPSQSRKIAGRGGGGGRWRALGDAGDGLDAAARRASARPSGRPAPRDGRRGVDRSWAWPDSRLGADAVERVGQLAARRRCARRGCRRRGRTCRACRGGRARGRPARASRRSRRRPAPRPAGQLAARGEGVDGLGERDDDGAARRSRRVALEAARPAPGSAERPSLTSCQPSTSSRLMVLLDGR